MTAPKRDRAYPVLGPSGRQDPNYARVVRYLTDLELAAETAAGLGSSGYQEALQAEARRRAEA